MEVEAVGLLSLALISAVALGICTKSKHPISTILGVFTLLISVVSSIFGALLVYFSAQGTIPDDNDPKALKVNEIYETVGVTAANGKYIVIIKDRDGNLEVRRLKQIPPKIFKKAKDANNPYVSYPRR